MAEWGFDFARLPLNYWAWGDRADWSVIREEPLKEIDRAIDLGRQSGIHVNLNFHRCPGYCINGREQEQADLFTGTAAQRQKAQDAVVYHWRAFARRYKGVPNRQLSFDLINEPPKMRSYEGYLEERYVEIVKALVAGIRDVDPGRLIFADGINIGQAPVLGIAGLGLVQSTRGYLPKAVSHFTATWVPKDEFESFAVPTWPMKDDQGLDLGQGPAPTGEHRSVRAPGEAGGPGARRRVGRVQQDPARDGAGMDGRQPLVVEGSRMGVLAVEPAGPVRRARQRA